MSRYLYRGFGIGTYETVADSLTPKAPGAFEHVFCYDSSITHDGSASHGTSTRNAVLRHQLNQAGLPTAGISTSPHRERAIFCAIGDDNKYCEGIIITINRDHLGQHGVVEYVVSNTVVSPSVPEDEEVILVSLSGGPLPLAIVVSEEKVNAFSRAEYMF